MEGKQAFSALASCSAQFEADKIISQDCDCPSPQIPGKDTAAETELKDYFIEKDGEMFAGMHLIIDCLGGQNLSSLETVERCMKEAVEAAGASLLHIHLHHFSPSGGISGVAVLAESHISIHSWPEYGFAALDVFMCGGAEPYKTIDIIKAAFEPEEIRIEELRRGKGALSWNDGLKKPSI